MKNIDHFDGDCFDFYKKIVKKKQDQDLKNRLDDIESDIQEYYEEYNDKFSDNNLETLSSANLSDAEQSDLSELYNFRNNALNKLRKELTTSEAGRILNTCPNCTINEIDSFDHYLPTSEFIEFNVNPKNLMPCCTFCNRKKTSNWRENGKRIFLNLYLDPLPNLQYLNVTFEDSDDIFDIQFFLNEPEEMDHELYKLIESHYEKLNLLERFRKNSNEVITNLSNSISSFIDTLPYETICELSKEKANKDRAKYGYNYWKSILTLTLLESDTLKKYVI